MGLLKLKYCLPLLLLSTISTPKASASAMEFLKGCLVMGGVGVGGTVMAASQSNADIKDSQILVVSGVTSCVIGGFLAMDIAKKAEMEASQELRIKNDKLKHSVYGVMHDLCVMKKECGPDGLPLPKTNKKVEDEASVKSPQTLKSGN